MAPSQPESCSGSQSLKTAAVNENQTVSDGTTNVNKNTNGNNNNTVQTQTPMLSAKSVISNYDEDIRQVQISPTRIQMVDEAVVVSNQILLDEELSVSSDTTDTLTAATNSPQHNSRKRCSEREATKSGAQHLSKSNSSDSSLASNVTVGGRSNSRKSSSASTRKYSFKTHARTYHHIAPRKMNKDGTASGGSYSMVAKLTQQFNEIIQKDKKLLEEVKRKNGVLMSRGGHVYKVIENPKEINKHNSTSTAASLSVSSKDSTAKVSMVQRNIKKFESSVRPEISIEKPTVPAKSTEVLRKLNESVANKNHFNQLHHRRLHLSLPQQNLHYADLQHKQSVLAPLEVVREEVKTPIETEDKVITAAADTTQNVPELSTLEFSFKDKNSQNFNNNNHFGIVVTNETETPLNGMYCSIEQMQTKNETKSNKITDNDETGNGNEDNRNGNELVVTQTTSESIFDRTDGTKSEEPNSPRINNNLYQVKQSAAAENDAKDILMCNDNYATVDKVNNNDDLDDVDEVTSDEKLKQRKHRYAKIYEKFRFRSPFSSSSSQMKNSSPTKSSPEKLTTSKWYSEHNITVDESNQAEAKILDALEVIDQKLKVLTDTETSSKMRTCDEDDVTDPTLILRENDDFEQRVLPNSSFVYQACNRQICNKQLIVTQAVNVALVNSIEGEQMIMEQKELQRQIVNNFETELISAINSKSSEVQEEAIYEPIAQLCSKEPKTENENVEQTYIFNSNDDIPIMTTDPTEDIYQTVEEARQSHVEAQAIILNKPNIETIPMENMLNDYESIAGSCEHAIPASANQKTLQDYGYEICEPPAEASSMLQINSTTTTNMRNTTDELPELPKPKRRLPKSPLPGKRPPKPASLVNCHTKNLTISSSNVTLNLLHDTDDHHYYADDENIYDTIKGSHCYESLHSVSVKLQKSSIKSSDSVSLTSNCYESITHYQRNTNNSSNTAGSISGSSLTISSDHKTNSLYEVSLAAGLHCVGGRRSSSGGGSNNSNSTSICGVGSSIADGLISSKYEHHYRHHTNTASSDNSDEWIDISDTELEGATGNQKIIKQQFIVVRERSRVHRSPDWSKRVRDKRLHQKKAISCIEDDSDHYYESLSPLGNKRHSTQLVQRTNSHHKRNQDLPKYALGASQRSKQYSASAHALGAGNGFTDDYDSFDTDTDDVYEAEEQMKNHNDSGVDIRNIKLPDPPPSTNQVYAMVKKFRNFISSKKSPGSASKQNSNSALNQQKVYENSSQFYVNGNIYESTPKSKSKSKKTMKKLPTPGKDTDIYENTEFHSPPAVATLDAKSLSNSEKNLSVHNSNTEISSSLTLRSKSKTGKSFKSRLRESLVGSSFDSKHLAVLTPTRSTFYIEDPSNSGSGELDSGFSEKASSGDLPTPDSQKFSTVARKAKKEAKSLSSQRRRTTIGIRPHEPPPPPPEDNAPKTKQVTTPVSSTTSWYAECGVFKNSSTLLPAHDEHSLAGSKSNYSQNGSLAANGTSWYAEAGLYQTSGISVASSSGSSGVSTGNETGLNDEMPHSMFLNEPLYQIYSAAKLESISRDMAESDGSTDGYEEIGQNCNVESKNVAAAQSANPKRLRPSALQLIEPKNGPSRTLWSEISEVINSCVLPTLTPRERGVQEAKFEILTSEASYLKSLNLLRSHYMNHPLFRDTKVVSARDRKALFSHIVPVHECSERLLTELESCWQDNIMLLGLSKRIYEVAEKYFYVYISFCEHQGRMDRTLRRLKEAKGIFSQNLDLLEASPTCCGLNLHSFLMLPMQRITRLPLLIDAVFSKVSPNDDEYDSWKMTLAIMNKIVTQCNDAANRCEQAYEIERISRQLEFPTSIRALAIAPAGVAAPGSKPRFLVKKGELTHLIWRGDDVKLTFGKKFTKVTIFAFLFSDLLVLTKRKSEEQFQVFDYCPRNMLTITSGDALPQLPTKDTNQTGKNFILMTLLENHERKTVELVLACPSVSEQERWLQAMRPPEAETPGEKLYEQWDCPQVITKHIYESNEPDVLSLEVGDVVNVTRKLPDGWYQGERIRDGAIGWFPGSYTEEVNSAHVRARNLKQRYRLLTFTATYLESQKRK